MPRIQHISDALSRRAHRRLRGAIDLHVHSGADWVARLLGDEEVVREALAAGMRGVLLKSHTRSTLESCLDVNRRLNAGHVAFSSLAINSKECLANPTAATRLIEGGLRLLYMPTIMADNEANPLNTDQSRVSITEKGRLRASLEEILRLAAENNCTVATGHCSRDERDALLRACARAGVRTVLVTHPEYYVTEIPLEEQIRLVERWPNVLFERTLYSVIDEDSARRRPGSMTIVPAKLRQMVRNIRQTGPERTVLSSDLGQTFLPRPVEGFAAFLDALVAEGISQTEIELMTKVNPLRCLGLYDEMLAEVLRMAFEEARGRFRSSFRKPLLGWTRADAPLFGEFRKCVSPDHLLPSDRLPGAASVISVFLPFGKDLVESNREGESPSSEWCLGYTEANAFLDVLTESLGRSIEQCGFAFVRSAAAHHLTGCHDPDIDAGLLTSNWSERHVAYACGLGTFGLNNLLITERGCAGRFSSLVASIPLPPRTRPTDERCLAKAGRECAVCVSRCPVGALSRDGFDRVKCWRYLVEQNDISREHGLAVVNVCGKCSSGVPCAVIDVVEENGQ